MGPELQSGLSAAVGVVGVLGPRHSLSCLWGWVWACFSACMSRATQHLGRAWWT